MIERKGASCYICLRKIACIGGTKIPCIISIAKITTMIESTIA